jgi:hypothetical protein
MDSGARAFMMPSEERRRWLTVMAFAIGMAWIESATVYYLRVMTDRIDPYQANPLPLLGLLGRVELVREAATLVMLAMVGMLASRIWRKRLAYALIAFGGWDIFYYVFLRLISGWPTSLFDWDILFLLPLPWWGPVLAPVSIALLMIGWGTLVTQSASSPPATALTRGAMWGLSTIGIALALYVFMEDALRTIPQGFEATRSVLPTSFNWALFSAAFVLMATPVAYLGWCVSRVPRFPDRRLPPDLRLTNDEEFLVQKSSIRRS